RLRFARQRKDLTNRVVDFDVRDRIRAWCASDWRLIHEDHIVDKNPAFEFLKRADVSLPFAALLLQSRVKAIVNQRRLAGAAHARHTDEHVERNLDVDRFEIVFRRALDCDATLLRRAALAWFLDLSVAAQIASRERSLVGE